MSRRSVRCLALLAAGFVLAGQQAHAQKGFRLGVSTGVFGSLTEVAPTSPAGIGFEVMPEWRTAGGFGLGLGFRYVVYPDVPDHGAIFLDVRKVWPRAGVAPLTGLRFSAFAGGDDGGDDPFIGLAGGPFAGIEVPVAPRLSVSVIGSGLIMMPLFRDLGFFPGLQVGLVIR